MPHQQTPVLMLHCLPAQHSATSTGISLLVCLFVVWPLNPTCLHSRNAGGKRPCDMNDWWEQIHKHLSSGGLPLKAGILWLSSPEFLGRIKSQLPTVVAWFTIHSKGCLSFPVIQPASISWDHLSINCLWRNSKWRYSHFTVRKNKARMQIPLSQCYNKVEPKYAVFSNQIEIYFFPSNSPGVRELTCSTKSSYKPRPLGELGHLHM